MNTNDFVSDRGQARPPNKLSASVDSVCMYYNIDVFLFYKKDVLLFYSIDVFLFYNKDIFYNVHKFLNMQRVA